MHNWQMVGTLSRRGAWRLARGRAHMGGAAASPLWHDDDGDDENAVGWRTASAHEQSTHGCPFGNEDEGQCLRHLWSEGTLCHTCPLTLPDPAPAAYTSSPPSSTHAGRT